MLRAVLDSCVPEELPPGIWIPPRGRSFGFRLRFIDAILELRISPVVQRSELRVPDSFLHGPPRGPFHTGSGFRRQALGTRPKPEKARRAGF